MAFFQVKKKDLNSQGSAGCFPAHHRWSTKSFIRSPIFSAASGIQSIWIDLWFNGLGNLLDCCVLRARIFLVILVLGGCSTSGDPTDGGGNFIACSPIGDWLVSKLVIDLNNDGVVDAFPAGSLSDDLVQFNSDGTGFWIDNFSNSTGLVNFNWSCNAVSEIFEMFGIAFNIDENIEKSLKISVYDSDLGVTLEVYLYQP